FVSVSTELATWHTINNTIGVSRLVSFGSKPKPLPLQLVSGLMLRCDASGVLLPPIGFSEGDSVEMFAGLFANFIATVDAIDPEQRICVLMDFMGQKTRMQVSSDQLQLS
ncbi:MAG: transcriptional activator RfaH, partial [Tateyamaria sp.]|nr:transcriptional activator RfaH [Tateyamaria sp.]